jgi:hypothetical protein
MGVSKKNILVRFLALIIAQSLIAFTSIRVQEETNNITAVLKKCGEYCSRLQNVTLDFVCMEKIDEKLFAGGTSIFGPTNNVRSIWRVREPPLLTKENNLVYDYQLIRKNRIINEIRTLLKENGVAKHEKNAPLETLSYWHKHIVLGPISLLSLTAQSKYDYRLIKEGKFNGEKAFIIEAAPKTNVDTEYLYGKAWISKKDFSVLKIEWKQESLRNYELVEKSVVASWMKPDIHLVSEYAFEKNGIRFPSTHIVKANYLHKRTGRRYRNAEIKVVYKDYKFFVVETDVKYK